MITKSVKRGDIVFYDFGTKPGSDKSGLRPVLVLQHDKFNTSSPTTIIAPIVPARKRKMCAHVLLEKRFGLLVDSMVFLEKMQIVDQEDIGDLIGHIDDPELMQLIDSNKIKYISIDERLPEEESIAQVRAAFATAHVYIDSSASKDLEYIRKWFIRWKQKP